MRTLPTQSPEPVGVLGNRLAYVKFWKGQQLWVGEGRRWGMWAGV